MALPQAQKRYLKVETPVTTDGRTLAYDENKQPIYRTTFLPITARTELLRNTSKLPEYLRPKITEEQGDAENQGEIAKEQRETKAEIKAESSGLKETVAVKPRKQKVKNHVL
jgi:hypothetical protein